MDLGLNGGSTLVLGGSRGLGRAVAKALAAEGATVTIVGRDGTALRDVAQAIAASSGAQVQAQAADLARTDVVDTLAELLRDVEILVLNGGGPPPRRCDKCRRRRLAHGIRDHGARSHASCAGGAAGHARTAL